MGGRGEKGKGVPRKSSIRARRTWHKIAQTLAWHVVVHPSVHVQRQSGIGFGWFRSWGMARGIGFCVRQRFRNSFCRQAEHDRDCWHVSIPQGESAVRDAGARCRCVAVNKHIVEEQPLNLDNDAFLESGALT